MKIGIIGTGSIVLNFAIDAANSGCKVYMNNPLGNHQLKEVVSTKKNIKLVGPLEAVVPEIVVFCVPYDKLENIINSLPDMTGKIILNPNNPIFYASSPYAQIFENSAAAKKTASLLPKAHLVNLYCEMQTITDVPITKHELKSRIFFSGDNYHAKDKTKSLLKKLNISGIDLDEKANLVHL